MSENYLFHLFIPCFLQPLKNLRQDASLEIEAPFLCHLLKQYTKTKNAKPQGIDGAFFQNLHPEITELPIAYYRHQVHTNKTKHGLICADPIHLEVGMNDVTLTKRITDLTDAEAQEQIDVLNQHFAEDGIQFIFGSNQCWYLSLDDENSTFKSHELDSVLKQNITDKLASSKNRNWQVIQNETQMLLHSSDINQQREISGLDTVNSLWFWGAGEPVDTKPKVDRIITRNEISAKLRGQLFAKAANCEWQPLTEETIQLSTSIDDKISSQMIVLDQLFNPALENNLDDYQSELRQLDQDVFQPLLELWNSKDIDIDIVIDCCEGTILTPEKSPSWKFWSKPKKLRELVDEINS